MYKCVNYVQGKIQSKLLLVLTKKTKTKQTTTIFAVDYKMTSDVFLGNVVNICGGP